MPGDEGPEDPVDYHGDDGADEEGEAFDYCCEGYGVIRGAVLETQRDDCEGEAANLAGSL